MNTFVIHSREPLVFRDGKPFGDPGHVNGSSLPWPMPSTVVGMLRSRIGLARSKEFFHGPNRHDNIEAIKRISATIILPLWQPAGDTSWSPLFPAPADALITKTNGGNFKVHHYTYHPPGRDEGVNLSWSNWYLPLTNNREKPAADSPPLWFAEVFMTWLEHGVMQMEKAGTELGVQWPACEFRIHTAIDDSGTAAKSHLFSTSGLRLEARKQVHADTGRVVHPAGRYGIGVALENMEPNDNPTGPCRLGGDGKIAHVEDVADFFPACPDWFGDDHYLRLVLVSPGNFGAWAPQWLLPDAGAGETRWRTVPDSDIEIRLVSAHVPRWLPLSGWDLARRGPKATVRLVPAGSVYVIELREPNRSKELASHLWGRGITDNPNEITGAQGCVCLGKIHTIGE